MSLAEVISCAPFRLASPRPLTGYEWTVVRSAIEEGYAAAGVFAHDPAIRPGVDALLAAIQQQTSCPAWKTSAFGPAPAVATYGYECLGGWYARLPALDQGRVVADIRAAGLLCRAVPPWSDCVALRGLMGKSAADLWEGSAQLGVLSPGVETCAAPRQRTAYAPMTGQQMLDMLRMTGGQLPGQFEQLAQLGASFVQRDFLVGIQMRPANPTLAEQVATAPTVLAAARLAIEEMAIIWKPGEGASILFVLDEPIDPAKVMALVSTMMPAVAGDVLGGWAGAVLPWLFPGTAPQQLVGRTREPGTPPTTGYRVLDQRGSSLPPGPKQLSSSSSVPGVPTDLLLYGAAALLTVGLLAVVLRR